MRRASDHCITGFISTVVFCCKGDTRDHQTVRVGRTAGDHTAQPPQQAAATCIIMAPLVTLLPRQMDEAGAKPMKNKQEQKNKAQTPRALPPAQTARPYHTVLLSPSLSPPPQLGLSLIGQSKALRFPCWKMGMEAVRGTCSTALQRQDGPAGLHLSFREFYSMQGREQPAKGLPGRFKALQAAQHGGVGARRLWS